MTGHGWRKLMRLAESFVYRVTQLAPKLPIFDFIQQAAGLDDRSMYGTFNMGCGFAVYVPSDQATRAMELAKSAGIQAWLGGTIEKEDDRKAVVIEPLGIAFEGESLKIRA